MTVLLAALIAFYSFAVQRQQGILQEYDEIQSAQISGKLSALRKLVQQDLVLEKRDSRYEQYLRSLRELKDLEARRQGNLQTLQQMQADLDWPFERDLESLGIWLLTVFKPAHLDAQLSIDPDKLIPLDTENAKACKAQPLERSNPKPAKIGFTYWRDDVTNENLDEFCFSKLVGVGHGSINYISSSGWVGRVRDRIMLQSTWILPFLSGLLGAAVFLLRDSLNPATANFGTPRAVVRLSIGGVAGIIIGWFWSPSSLMGTELARVSSIPFALAFLTGYSIDILFSALERARAALTSPHASAKDGK